MAEQGGLVLSGGVDEGSTAGGARSGTAGQGLLGEPPHGAPAGESDAAGPVRAAS